MKPKKNTDITKRGKPVIIDVEKLETLASRFWTKTEIASFFNCSDRHIADKYSDIYTKGRESGKARLRDLQLKAANQGNVTMLIWLGKQYLEQTDKETVNDLTGEELSRLRQIAAKEMTNAL